MSIGPHLLKSGQTRLLATISVYSLRGESREQMHAHRLKRRILKRGWNVIKIDSEFLRSSVGDTAQEAIANGLKLVLRKSMDT